MKFNDPPLSFVWHLHIPSPTYGGTFCDTAIYGSYVRKFPELSLKQSLFHLFSFLSVRIMYEKLFLRRATF